MGLLGAIATGVGAGLEGVSKNLDRESVYQQQMALLREKLNIEREGKNTDRQEGQVRFQEARGNLLKDVASSQYGAAMDAYKNADGIDGMSAEEVQQAGTQHVQGLIDSYRPDAKTSAQIDARAAIEVGDKDRGTLANQSLQALQRDEQVEASTLLRKELEAGRNSRNEADNRARLDDAFLRGSGRGTGTGSRGGSGAPRGIGGENLGKAIDSATKPFMSAFEANKDAGTPADEQGKAAYFMLVRDGIASGKDSTQVASLALRRILDARSAAQGDDKKYLMLLNAMLTPPKPPMSADEQEAMRENRLFQQLGGSGPAAKTESSGEGVTSVGGLIEQEMQRTKGPSPSDNSSFADRQRAVIDREKKINSDEELQQLMAAHKQALRNGKAVQANDILSKYNRLRKERYGR